MTLRAAPDHVTDPIVAAFERHVERDPGRLLVLGPDGASSRADVDALARAAALSLERARLPAGGPVGVVASNGASFLAVHPSKRFLYAVNEGSSMVAAFSIDAGTCTTSVRLT